MRRFLAQGVELTLNSIQLNSINLFQNIKFHIHMNYHTVKYIIQLTNYKQVIIKTF